MTPPAIEPATFLLVAQCLKQVLDLVLPRHLVQTLKSPEVIVCTPRCNIKYFRVLHGVRFCDRRGVRNNQPLFSCATLSVWLS
jgi:hypothetical protein